MSRLRANQITNENANGAPNFPHGLTVTGIITATNTQTNFSNIVVGSAVTANSQGIDVTGVVTATSFKGDGTNLTGVDPSATASSSGFLKVLNATTPQIRLSVDTGDSDDQKRAFFGIATGSNNFLTGSSANDTVLRARGGGDLLIGVGSTIRMRVDELGRVTKPAQPCFSGFNATGNGQGSAGAAEKMKYHTTGAMSMANVGDMHNSTNGRFTAPVAGNYIFFWSNLISDDKYSHLYKNGSQVGGGSKSLSYTGNPGYNDLSAGGIITLAANDYVQFGFEGSGQVYLNDHGACFFALLS